MKVSTSVGRALLLACLGVAAACSNATDAPTASLELRRISRYVSDRQPDGVHIISRVPAIANNAEVAAKTQAAERKLYWIHQLHRLAQREMIVTQLKRSAADRADREKTCALAIRIALKTIDRARFITGDSPLPHAEKWQQLKPGALQSKCSEQAKRYAPGTMSIFAATLSSTVVPQSTELSYWSNELTNAFNNAGDGGVAITDAMGTVMVNAASNLPSAEYETLAELGNVLMQSSIDWQEYYDYVGAGGGSAPCGEGSPYAGGPGCDGDDEWMTSIFRRQEWQFAWIGVYWELRSGRVDPHTKAVALADFVGGLAAAAAGGGGIVAWAAIASIAAY